MSGPVSLAACPNGHASVDRALCSVCGIPLMRPAATGPDATPSVPSMPIPPAGPPPAPAAAPPPVPGAESCPHCTAALDPGTRFCEVCGYDPATGSLPHMHAPEVRPAAPPPAAPPPPAPPPSTGTLLAVITADRPYYERNDISEVQFPLGVPPRVIELRPGAVSIGRRSYSRGTNPVVDLAGPPEDPAVSHTHASLLPSDDGTWTLVDHGSTNGTYLNESPQPVPANSPLPVAPGDRIYIGAWTRITLEVRPAPGMP